MCHAPSRLVYDMVWIDEKTLFTLAASMEDGSKALDCYAVRDDRLVYTPSYIPLDAKGCYTRLIFCRFDAAVSPVGFRVGHRGESGHADVSSASARSRPRPR